MIHTVLLTGCQGTLRPELPRCVHWCPWWPRDIKTSPVGPWEDLLRVHHATLVHPLHPFSEFEDLQCHFLLERAASKCQNR